MKLNRWLRSVLVAVLIGAAYALARSQPVPATDPVPRVVFPVRTSGNISTVGIGTADAANAAKYSFGAAANGSVFATTGADLPTPGGRSIPLTVAGTIPKASVVGALGRFMGKTLPVLSNGVALYELGKELGYILDNSSGSLQVSESVAPANASAFDASSYSYCAAQYYPGEVCQVYEKSPGYANMSRPLCLAKPSNPSYCYGLVDGAALPTVSVPRTQQEFLDAVAAKSGWPSSSALARTMRDALKAGEIAPVEPTSVTGPATSPGGSTVTHDAVNNKTTTSTVTNHHAYAGDTVTTTITTTNITINDATGLPEASSTSTETPALPDPVKPCGLPDSPACKIDETGMPDADDMKKDAAKDAYSPVKDFVDHPESLGKPMPTINWAFSLPTACGVIPAGAFSAFMPDIDICQFQPMFHSIMAVVWQLGALFGAISLFMKSALGD